MSYELGQRAALEKLAVFQEWVAMRPGGLRAPHARGRGTDFASTAADVTKNLRNKYYHRAPKAVTAITDTINTVAANMPSAKVKRLTLGSTGNSGDAGSSYSLHDQHIVLNDAADPAGTLGHEAGHATGKMLQSDSLLEEARATQNFIATHGRDHADVPGLLRAFGTYAQSNEWPTFMPRRPARFESLRKRLDEWRHDTEPNYMPNLMRDMAAMDQAAARRASALTADKAPLEAQLSQLTEQANAMPGGASTKIQRKIDHYRRRIKGLERYYAAAGRDYVSALDAASDTLNAERKRQVRATLDRIDNINNRPHYTLQDYSNLQGTQRQQFEDWLGRMRSVIDSHFWKALETLRWSRF